jgi:hypothetical protein
VAEEGKQGPDHVGRIQRPVRVFHTYPEYITGSLMTMRQALSQNQYGRTPDRHSQPRLIMRRAWLPFSCHTGHPSMSLNYSRGSLAKRNCQNPALRTEQKGGEELTAVNALHHRSSTHLRFRNATNACRTLIVHVLIDRFK